MPSITGRRSKTRKAIAAGKTMTGAFDVLGTALIVGGIGLMWLVCRRYQSSRYWPVIRWSIGTLVIALAAIMLRNMIAMSRAR